MLKFIRKYQMIILAIGGSLLMVVFLLEPVITSLQRSQNNRTVARYADGTTVGAIERERANVELQLAQRVAPFVFAPVSQGGLGLYAEDTNGQDRVLHWIMFARLAEEAGLVGGANDGRALIDDQIDRMVQQYIQQNMMAVFQGIVTQEELQAQAIQSASLLTQQFEREVSNTAGMIRATSVDEVWRMLARFKGAYRLIDLYYGVAAYSPGGARAGVSDLNNAAAVNAALIPGSVLAHTIDEPSEAELQAFFEPRAGLQPGEDEFGIGYAQPARVKLFWMRLDREQFRASVPLDRVELRKIYDRDGALPEGQRQYPGDFDSERANIERAFRDERADRMLVEADQIIRARVQSVTRLLERQGQLLVLPEDWSQRRPSFESIAESITSEFASRDISVPTPTIQQIDDRWLSSNDIARLPMIGNAAFRAGSRTNLVARIPDEIDENGLLGALPMQVNVPQVEPAAVDQAGNRYYLLVTDHLVAGPSRSIDDAGPDRVIADYKSVVGYERLRAMVSELESAAGSPEGVSAAIDLGVGGLLPEGVQRPGVYPNIRVSRMRIDQGPLARDVDQRLNTEAFRESAIAMLEGIDPLATPADLTTAPITTAVELPASRSVAVARLVAPRPFTSDQFRARFARSLGDLAGMNLRDAFGQVESADPFSYDSLFDRYGLVEVGGRDGDQ